VEVDKIQTRDANDSTAGLEAENFRHAEVDQTFVAYTPLTSSASRDACIDMNFCCRDT
jgi:hypothetical protein